MIKLEDTQGESAPQNKTETLRQNMNMEIWVVSNLNQFIYKTFLY